MLVIACVTPLVCCKRRYLRYLKIISLLKRYFSAVMYRASFECIWICCKSVAIALCGRSWISNNALLLPSLLNVTLVKQQWEGTDRCCATANVLNLVSTAATEGCKCEWQGRTSWLRRKRKRGSNELYCSVEHWPVKGNWSLKKVKLKQRHRLNE